MAISFLFPLWNLEPQKDFSGKLFSLTEQVAWCWQHWQPPEELVLIVLDDVTSLDGCRDFLPRANRFRVLMTTRSRKYRNPGALGDRPAGSQKSLIQKIFSIYAPPEKKGV